VVSALLWLFQVIAYVAERIDSRMVDHAIYCVLDALARRTGVGASVETVAVTKKNGLGD